MLGDLKGRRVTVMGLGRFGGGVGAARFLAERGARVTVTDLADEAALADSLAAIGNLKLERLRLGGHSSDDFRRADLIVASPAVRPDHPLLLQAAAAGAVVTTEIGLFWPRCRGWIVGVTGSVGKSTTAAMIHAVLAASGRRAWLGGNIGGSLLADVDRIAAEDWVVLELSSFQLEYLAPLRPRPNFAVVTNLRPNHLDRHGTLDAYRAAKQTLLRWQTGDDVAVLNADDPDVSDWPANGSVAWFGGEGHLIRNAAFIVEATSAGLTFQDRDSTAHYSLALPIPGDHHRLNAAAAAAAALAVGVSPDQIVSGLEAFRGLPHRLQVVGKFDGRLWVNDSKATTPESAIAALRSFDRPVRLIAGGADKGVDLSPLADEIVARGVAGYLSGRTGPAIAAVLKDRGHEAFGVYESFDASVAAARSDSRTGDLILLSPGCASWGQFRDYRERGERFASLAKQLG